MSPFDTGRKLRHQKSGQYPFFDFLADRWIARQTSFPRDRVSQIYTPNSKYPQQTRKFYQRSVNIGELIGRDRKKKDYTGLRSKIRVKLIVIYCN